MKTIKIFLILPLLLLVIAGCKKDNYAAPDAGIYGALTDGETGGALELSEAGNNSNIRMIVNDPAKYPSPSTFDLAINADGTYTNNLVFAENYKVFPLAQSGPWQYPAGDSVSVAIHSGQRTEVNFKVIPFFRVAATVTDSTITYTITKAAATTSNDLNGNNNVLVLVNNFATVDENVSSNGEGSYYENQFHFSATNASLGVAQTQTIAFSKTHLAKGDYFFRVAVIGSGSNGKFNYSPVVKATVH